MLETVFIVYEPVSIWYLCDLSVSPSPLDLGIWVWGLSDLVLGDWNLENYFDQVDGK